MCQECRDVGWLDEATKVTWATSKHLGPLFSRDFVTRCHYRKLRDGSLMLATMSEQLRCDMLRSQGLSPTPYVRMEVLLSGYVMRPVAGGAKTQFHAISLSNPGGVFDTRIGAYVANKVAATGPVNFIAAIRRLSCSDRLKPDPSPSYPPLLPGTFAWE